MAKTIAGWERRGEKFWRAHHEAWKRSDLNQREYCEAHRVLQKAFENWRQISRREPEPPTPKLLHRRGGLSHSLSHTLSHVAYSTSAVAVPPSHEGRRRRFMQPDPIGYSDGMAIYAYVAGDPVNAADPTGLSREASEEIIVIGKKVPRQSLHSLWHNGLPGTSSFQFSGSRCAGSAYGERCGSPEGVDPYLVLAGGYETSNKYMSGGRLLTRYLICVASGHCVRIDEDGAVSSLGRPHLTENNTDEESAKKPSDSKQPDYVTPDQDRSQYGR